MTIALFAFLGLTAQEQSIPSLSKKNNELKIGILTAVLYPGLELEYEHLMTPSTSVGGNISYIFDANNSYYDYYTDAYFRFYFNEKKEYGMNGFFAQTYLSFLAKQNEIYYDYEVVDPDYDTPPQNDYYNTLGIGFGLGKKWTTSRGFSIQTIFTLGRNFSDSDYYDEIVPRFDIYFGYRF